MDFIETASKKSCPRSKARPPQSESGKYSSRLKARRKALGLSQSQAANQWGLQLQTLQQWEHGRRQPRGVYRRHIDAILSGCEARKSPDRTATEISETKDTAVSLKAKAILQSTRENSSEHRHPQALPSSDAFKPTDKNIGSLYCDFEDAIPSVVALLDLFSTELRHQKLSPAIAISSDSSRLTATPAFKFRGIVDICQQVSLALEGTLDCFELTGDANFIRDDAAETLKAATQQAVAALMMISLSFRSEVIHTPLRSDDPITQILFLQDGACALSRNACARLIETTTKLLEAMR